MEYASRAVGNTALGFGIAGSALGLLNGAGGLMGILGGQNRPQDPGDRPVTRYEMGLYQQINDKNVEIAELRSTKYTDNVAAGIQQEIGQQLAWNAAQTAVMECQQKQLQQLYSLTQLTIPNANVNPGWGPAVVRPAPVPATEVATPVSNT